MKSSVEKKSTGVPGKWGFKGRRRKGLVRFRFKGRRKGLVRFRFKGRRKGKAATPCSNTPALQGQRAEATGSAGPARGTQIVAAKGVLRRGRRVERGRADSRGPASCLRFAPALALADAASFRDRV